MAAGAGTPRWRNAGAREHAGRAASRARRVDFTRSSSMPCCRVMMFRCCCTMRRWVAQPACAAMSRHAARPNSPPAMPAAGTRRTMSASRCRCYLRRLDFCRDNAIWPNVEIKPAPGHELRTGTAVARAIAAAYADLVRAGGDRAESLDPRVPLLSSFAPTALRPPARRRRSCRAPGWSTAFRQTGSARCCSWAQFRCTPITGT